MKNKNIKISSFIFLVWLVAMVFCFGKKSFAEENDLIINEIRISGGAGKSTEEFIEIYNLKASEINLKMLPLKLHLVSSTNSDSSKTLTFIRETISPKGYFLIASKNYADNNPGVLVDATYSTSGNSLVSNGALYISTSAEDKKNILNFIGLGTNNYFDTHIIPNHKDENSSERVDFDSDNWQESYILGGTPGKENSKKPEEEEEEEEEEEKKDEKDYAGKLKINEILPAPKTQNDGKEFVEIINISTETISLSSMRIEDEKNHKVTFPEKTIAPLELFILEGNFELNNTSPDSAYLITKDGTKENPIDSISYEKPKYDYAYAYDGTAWQWTSKITRGAKNEFDKLLTGEIKKDKTIYAGIYANFEAKTNGKAKKFTWDFGDSHKSYLKKTRHKYAETGTYAASLKITGDGKDNLINFTVEVEKFGKAKVRIVGLSANPKGSDSDNEWLEIWNGTKKKIDLKGWSVATGWKNLYNHPITKKFILKAGETKKLTREFCAFALGNKQAKIELRYPDGKVADKIKYDRKNNSISEDELYQKTTAGWDWTTPEKEPTPTNEESEKPVAPISETLTEEKPKEINVDIDLSLLGKYSENPAWQQKQKGQTILLLAKSNIDPEKFLAKNQGRVLGISTAKFAPEKTALSSFSPELVWKKINAKLNQLILMF